MWLLSGGTAEHFCLSPAGNIRNMQDNSTLSFLFGDNLTPIGLF